MAIIHSHPIAKWQIQGNLEFPALEDWEKCLKAAAAADYAFAASLTAAGKFAGVVPKVAFQVRSLSQNLSLNVTEEAAQSDCRYRGQLPPPNV